MITFLELGQLGRLGNQLFQYAALKSLSLRKGYKIKLPQNIDNTYWHGQKCLLSNFNLNYDYLSHEDFSTIKTTYTQSDYTGPAGAKVFHESFFDVEDNTNLYGFYQNLNYFHEYETQIKNEFLINNSIQKQSQNYLEEVIGIEKPIVAIHMRRKDHEDVIINDEVSDNYVKKAINYFNNEVNFLIFVGGSTQNGNDNSHDIDYIKNKFNSNNFYISETKDTMLDFCLMSKCEHVIVSHDSTYSWWAAYLNQNKNKNIIAPKKTNALFFGEISEYKNYYPENWILFD
jgi:hypothetical protein